MKAIFLSLLSVSALAAEPQVVTKEVTGEAAIVKGDVAKATDQAVQAALREAVSQTAGVFISSDTSIKNSVLVRDEISSHAKGYVKKYDITKKSTDKGVVTVSVKADVIASDIDKDLAVVKQIVKRLGRTKLLIVTQEALIDARGISSRSELLSTRLTQVFRDDGWRIIDEHGTGVGTDDKLVFASGVSAKELADKVVAKRTDVDYIVYGEIKLRYVPPADNQMIPEKDSTGKQILFFVEGEYDLALMEVRTGRSLTKIAGKLNLSPAMRNGTATVGYEATAKALSEDRAPQIAAELRGPMMEYLRDQVVNGQEVELKVSGLPDFGAVDEIQREISSVSAVKTVRVSGDFENGVVTYSVHVDGTASDLGKALDKAKVLKEKRTLKTTAVKNNVVEVAIAK